MLSLVCCAYVAGGAGIAAAQTPGRLALDRLVQVEHGDLPIILSAPHGGSDLIPGVPERRGSGAKLFRSKSDAFTGQLTEKLADAIEEKLGRRPYVVIARFHRKYLDANRRARDAFESPQAEPVYHAYHKAISDARRAVTERWGRGILIDIHGQAAEPKAIFRGTQNGKTTTYLYNRFGREAMTGETSLFGQLASQGFPVIPAIGSTNNEHPSYDGGYTVITHGSQSGGTVDAIQLELGRDLRVPGANGETANKLAKAITEFSSNYLSLVDETSPIDRNVSKESRIAGTERITDADDFIFIDDFSDGDRNGWFELDVESSTISVKSESGQLSSVPELNFASSDRDKLQTFATHFSGVELKKAGDFITLQFDARHNHSGFVNRGFRFGLFDGTGTRFEKGGDLSTNSTSLDDKGYFAMLDLGRSTSFDSAVIRESTNAKDRRLWNGGRIAFDKGDTGPDPLMFGQNRSYHYSLTLTRNTKRGVDAVLKNNVSGEQYALAGSSTATPTLKFDTIYFGVLGSIADFAIDNVTVTNRRRNAVDAEGDAVRVGVYFDKGAGPSVNDLLFVLSKFNDVSVTRLRADDIRAGKLAELDLLMQPGGSGGGQGRHLGEEGRAAICGFVKDGGGFVGICAGSYLASADYSWSLNILDAKVVDRQHWNRGMGTVDIAMTDSGSQLLGTDRRKLPIHYAQGPLLAPGNRPDIEDYEVIATFETEIAKNGAPELVMKGTTAIARGNFGSGRVICFSPHPEMTNGLEQMVRSAIDDVKRNRSTKNN